MTSSAFTPKPRPARLAPDELRPRLADEALPFASTEELEPLTDPVGQARAVEAIRFAMGVEGEGYNLFVTGPHGSGRHTLVRELLEAHARARPVPSDVCYVHDFDTPERPRPILLAPGKGRAFERTVSELVTELKTVLPAAFESDEFQREKDGVEQALKEEHEKALHALKARADERGVALVSTPMGFAIIPVKNGRLIEPDELEKASVEEKKRLEAAVELTKRELGEILESVPREQKKMRARLRELVEKTASAAVRHLIEDAKRDWQGEAAVLAHLDALEKDVRENVEDFLKQEEKPDGGLVEIVRSGGRVRRYQVNVLVDHGKTVGAPVVYETHPTHPALVGRIEHLQQLGALVTDFNLIKPGALHRANGGFLLLDARLVLQQPYAWEGLKRVLLSREIKLESVGQALGLVSTVSLEPVPIPLSVKVVLFGEREILRLLELYDPDFRALFKVVADFDEEIPKSAENSLLYARLLGGVVRREGLLHVERAGVRRVLDEASRHAGDSRKLSGQVLEAFDLVREATHFARARGASLVTEADVKQAVDAQERRSGRLRERTLEVIADGTLMVDTDGARVGQVNGLSVLMAGRSTFGRPSRITAKVRLGRGEVVDIEREVELGGPFHSKGVLILTSFLGARYAPDAPLSLHASLVFEQSYGLVDGDSASCAETCALLSALSGVAIDQSLAITGSMNQHGEVQAIGGANEKIEGFFEVCKARGLTGRQGVVLPASNVHHLVLSDEVVEAVERGRFHVYPVKTVDEAIEALTGVEAGVARADGSYPEGTVNHAVAERLAALAKRRLELGQSDKAGGERGRDELAQRAEPGHRGPRS